MSNNEKLFGNISFDRRIKILEILEEEGQAKVPSLSKKFEVSEVTIRNDLDQLEQKGLLIRTRGGAFKAPKVGLDYSLDTKTKKNKKEKEQIGKAASKLIKDNETIILDSGTTTMQIAKNLSTINNLTVISNALNIIGQLVYYPNTKVIVPGGHLRNESLSLIGHSAANELQNYYCDKLFLGVDGIDCNFGITTPNPEEAYLNKIMIDISKQVIVVTDSSKFNNRSFAYISSIDKISTIVTDNNIPKIQLGLLQSAGINIIIAD